MGRSCKDGHAGSIPAQGVFFLLKGFDIKHQGDVSKRKDCLPRGQKSFFKSFLFLFLEARLAMRDDGVLLKMGDDEALNYLIIPHHRTLKVKTISGRDRVCLAPWRFDKSVDKKLRSAT